VWFHDLNCRYSIGEAIAPGKQWLRGSYIEVGGVNIFNRLLNTPTIFLDSLDMTGGI